MHFAYKGLVVGSLRRGLEAAAINPTRESGALRADADEQWLESAVPVITERASQQV
jgi:hypothetical protein